MTRRLLLVAVAALLAVPATATAATGAEPDILFSASPKNVTILKSGKTLRLSLPAGVRTTWFTDRPDRKAGTTTLNRLAGTWTAMGFRKDPPNAALLLTHKGQTRTHVVTLTDPRVRKGRVSFRIRDVKRGTEAGHRHTDALRRGRYARAQLFIDDATYPPCGAMLINNSACLLASNAETMSAGGLYTTSNVAACSMVQAEGFRPTLDYRNGFSGEGEWNPPVCGTDGPVPLAQDLPNPIWITNLDPSPSAVLLQVDFAGVL